MGEKVVSRLMARNGYDNGGNLKWEAYNVENCSLQRITRIRTTENSINSPTFRGIRLFSSEILKIMDLMAFLRSNRVPRPELGARARSEVHSIKNMAYLDGISSLVFFFFGST